MFSRRLAPKVYHGRLPCEQRPKIWAGSEKYSRTQYSLFFTKTRAPGRRVVAHPLPPSFRLLEREEAASLGSCSSLASRPSSRRALVATPCDPNQASSYSLTLCLLLV